MNQARLELASYLENKMMVPSFTPVEESTHHGQHHAGENAPSTRAAEVYQNIILHQASNIPNLTLALLTTIREVDGQYL